jgi:hypothetical protein
MVTCVSCRVKLAKAVVRGSGSARGRAIKQQPCVHFTVESLRRCGGRYIAASGKSKANLKK